jgi:hypothetical protein
VVRWFARGLFVLGVVMPAAAVARAARPAPPYVVRVVEMSQTVDLTRDGMQWLVVTVEVAARGADRAPLRHVQPLREHFDLQDEAGNRYVCAWLKGGTSVENPAVLRFQAGFPMPAGGTRKVALTMLLPLPRASESVDLVFKRADLARLPATIQTPQGAVTVSAAEEQPYTPPALPEGGRYTMKGIPADSRVFQRPLRTGEQQPDRAFRVSWRSPAVDLFDRGLDIDGSLTGADGKKYPLLSAALERFPSRSAKDVSGAPTLSATYWFRSPPKGVVSGLALSFTLRANEKEHEPVEIRNLPVPGR